MTRSAQGPVRTARMMGSSIAAPSAAPWVTDFLNAAYYARPEGERDVADLRLAHCILSTRWALHAPRRLGVRDLPAFHRAFGSMRARSRGLLDRAALLEGAADLIGDWFPGAVVDERRRAYGMAFATAAARREFAPELRQRHGALGPLTPPTHPPAERSWATYPPVELPDPRRALAMLRSPARWPDFGSELGSFTPVRSGGLSGQTFEIEIVLQIAPRVPVLTRAYVTCTRVLRAGGPLSRWIAAIAAHVEEVLPPDASALTMIVLTTHRGHFLGNAISHLLVFAQDGRSYVRDIGCWDPLPRHLVAGYVLGGHEAQQAFWGPQPAARSMLAQLALVSSGARGA